MSHESRGGFFLMAGFSLPPPNFSRELRTSSLVIRFHDNHGMMYRRGDL